ncbi:MAG: glycine dehydrogenase (aminomethyl-transferring), partial [Lutibacter sp.]|nr:glycine dehydrogenase (aminomethyl-transferring) [Lutibacter sp.]
MRTDSFVLRHIGPRENEVKEMVATIGVQSLDELINKTIPTDIRLAHELNLPKAMSEFEYLTHIQKIAGKNKLFKNYIGLGYHPTILPGVIQRNILENPGWYTSYTPYQAEISQGRIEALITYQTMICDLTGLKIANASLLDEGTAAAEAMLMLYNSRSRNKTSANALKFFVSNEVLPQTVDV